MLAKCQTEFLSRRFEGYLTREFQDKLLTTDLSLLGGLLMKLEQKAEVISKETPDMSVRIKTIKKLISRAIVRKTLKNRIRKETVDQP